MAFDADKARCLLCNGVDCTVGSQASSLCATTLPTFAPLCGEYCELGPTLL